MGTLPRRPFPFPELSELLRQARDPSRPSRPIKAAVDQACRLFLPCVPASPLPQTCCGKRAIRVVRVRVTATGGASAAATGSCAAPPFEGLTRTLSELFLAPSSESLSEPESLSESLSEPLFLVPFRVFL
jgi:hypothetical protein